MLLSSLICTEVKHAEERMDKVGEKAEEMPAQSQPALADSKEVLLVGMMKVLDWSDAAKPKCIPCKLVLLIEKGVHKLEIYMPPKVSDSDCNHQQHTCIL